MLRRGFKNVAQKRPPDPRFPPERPSFLRAHSRGFPCPSIRSVRTLQIGMPNRPPARRIGRMRFAFSATLSKAGSSTATRRGRRRLRVLAEHGPTDPRPLSQPHRNERVGRAAPTADHVARIVKPRTQLAGIKGDWAGYDLGSGVVTEAGRRMVPLGEVMAMTEHRSAGTVIGYFQAGASLSSRASELLKPTPASSLGLSPQGEDCD